MKEKLQIEMDAKNRAYAFIVAMGLLNEFAQFCETIEKYSSEEIHTATLLTLAEQHLM